MGALAAIRTAIAKELPTVIAMGLQVTTRLNQPLSGHRSIPLKDSSLPPVVLLHGFIAVAHHMRPWEELFDSHATYALGYASTGDVLETCTWVREQILEIHQHHNQPVLLIGHSLGGLLLLAAASGLGDGVVRHCVTVCSPHGPATLPSGPLDSLRALAQSAPTEHVTTIAAEYDMVVPVLSAVLEEAELVLVRNAGHLSVIRHPRTLRALADLA